jgi:hypothetical protein
MKSTLFGVVALLLATAACAEGVESLNKGSDSGSGNADNNIAKELVSIRQEIAELHASISQEKELYGDKLRSLSNQKTDLEVRIGRNKLNIKDLQRELDVIAAKNEKKSASSGDLPVMLASAIAALRTTIERDVPFKHDDRLQALADIEYRLNAHIVSPNKAANQLWAFIEDELMLGKSNGVYKDLLTLSGEQKLVKVLRLGKVALFYRSNDAQYGVVRKDGESWQFVALEDRADIESLDTLFDSFNKNIRTGVFTLPNFLPKS